MAMSFDCMSFNTALRTGKSQNSTIWPVIYPLLAYIDRMCQWLSLSLEAFNWFDSIPLYMKGQVMCISVDHGTNLTCGELFHSFEDIYCMYNIKLKLRTLTLFAKVATGHPHENPTKLGLLFCCYYFPGWICEVPLTFLHRRQFLWDQRNAALQTFSPVKE